MRSEAQAPQGRHGEVHPETDHVRVHDRGVLARPRLRAAEGREAFDAGEDLGDDRNDFEARGVRFQAAARAPVRVRPVPTPTTNWVLSLTRDANVARLANRETVGTEGLRHPRSTPDHG